MRYPVAKTHHIRSNNTNILSRNLHLARCSFVVDSARFQSIERICRRSTCDPYNKMKPNLKWERWKVEIKIKSEQIYQKKTKRELSLEVVATYE